MANTLSRRTLLRGAASSGAISVGPWWREIAEAQARQPYVRASAHSPAGRRALVSYRNAVAEMNRRSDPSIRPPGDPRDPIGWLFQYKVHQYPDNFRTLPPADRPAAKEKELDDIFGKGTPERELAKLVLGSCHGGGGVWDDFWPWHRMYLFFFERICRHLSNDPDFALPYWGYSDEPKPGQPSRRVLPVEFRSPADKKTNALWHERRASINDIQSPTELPGSLLSPNYLGKDKFLSQPGAQGAQASFESTTHGNVHVHLGTESGSPKTYDMLEVGKSPNDPIFWLHHCECDRMWEYWLSLGGDRKNPTDADWLMNKNDLNEHFTFIDADKQTAKAQNMGVLDTKAIVVNIGGLTKTLLGYTYDELPPPPPGSGGGAVASIMLVGSVQRRTIAESPTLAIGSRRSDVELDVKPAVRLLSEKNLLSAGQRQVLLRIEEIAISRETAANIGIYLDLPPNISGKEADKYLVDVISTFGLGGHAGHGSDAHPVARNVTFDITRLVLGEDKMGMWQSTKPRLSTVVLDGALSDSDIAFRGVAIEVTSRTALPQQ